MDILTPVGSLNAWLGAPDAEPRSPFQTRKFIQPSKWSVSEPIPIPCLPNPKGPCGASSQLDPSNGANLKTVWAERWHLHKKASATSADDAKTHTGQPDEGTVRRGRHMEPPPAVSGCTNAVPAYRAEPHSHHQHRIRSLDAVTSASLPQLPTQQDSAINLSYLCRALSSPVQEAGTLACPVKPQLDQEAQRAVTDAPELALPMPSTVKPRGVLVLVASVALTAICDHHGQSAEGAAAAVQLHPTTPHPPRCSPERKLETPNRQATESPAACCRDTCGHACGSDRCCNAGGPIVRAAPAAVAALRVLAPCSSKRGLYEGTVRNGSMRNNWQYTYCCTVAS